MLDRLRRGEQRGIEHLLVGDVAGYLICFLDDAINGRAVHRLWRLPMHLEDLLEPLYMALGLRQVLLEPLLELRSLVFEIIVGKALMIWFSA